MKEEQKKRMKQEFTDAGKRSALNKHNAIRPLCPTCGSDSLITLSGITYCMNDCCDGVKGHNVLKKSNIMKLKGDYSIDESGQYTVIFEDESGEEWEVEFNLWVDKE